MTQQIIHEPEEIIATLDNEGMSIKAEKAHNNLEHKKLSASLVTGLVEGCHARWLADQYVIRDLIEEIDNPARRGNIFHDIMETFFKLPNDQRTHEQMRTIVQKVLTEDYPDMAKIQDVVQWVRDAVNGYYNMGAKPETVNVAEIEQYNRKTQETYHSGLEVYIEGKIGDTSRPALGFIDRVIYDHRTHGETLVIEDWKTGAKAKKIAPKWRVTTKQVQGLAEQRQQMSYTMMMEDMGHKISGARLIYPVAQEIVPVNIQDKRLRERTVTDFEKADAEVNNLVKTNRFEYTPSALCSWCPLAKICPAAMKPKNEKMEEAWEKQPEPEILRLGIDF